VRPAPVPGYKHSRSPGSPEFDPFWARIAEAGIPVFTHSSDSGYDDYASDWDASDEYLPFAPSPFRYVTMSDRPIFDMMTALITHGVFTRHPAAKVVSVENGSHWVLPMLKKLEKAYRLMPGEFSGSPTETFRKNIWVAPFYEEPIRALADVIGVERVLFGSDYPHPEGLADPLSFVDELDGFNDAEIRQIMRENLEGLL
jgi:predicted TIM-barrel fold metal-dependent hydrolase